MQEFAASQAIVAIPIRDEAERIADCLLALSNQDGPAPDVLLFVNDTTDRTLDVVAELTPELRCSVRIVEHRFAPGQGGAGQARRLAMQHADRVAPSHSALLTTDADGQVDPDWVAANLHHLRNGCDAVFGRAIIDPVEALQIPPALHQADAEECAYAALLDEIEHLIDPDAVDPWPRHVEHSGASIAVRRDAFRIAGGIPRIALGEDRAFAAALRRIDARVRHAPEVRVVVSGRIIGRAAGGMADTIRRRLVAPDPLLDDLLEPAMDRVRRIRLRTRARIAFAADDARSLFAIAVEAGLQPAVARALPGSRHFGEVWAAIDAALPRLRVAVAELAIQQEAGLAIRDSLLPRHASVDLPAA